MAETARIRARATGTASARNVDVPVPSPDARVPAPRRRRERLLRLIERRLELSLIVLGLVWLALLVYELVAREHPVATLASHVIWGIFVAEFAVRLAIAPRRVAFLKRNALAAVSLALPVLRVLRIGRALRALRAARAIRSVRLVRIVTGLNRGVRGLRRVLAERRFGYVMAATALITLAGAAGMYAFERDAGTLETWTEALWWTAMIMTTMGSERWPATPEGRVLCLLLATWAFAMFGYITATLATWFVGRDAPRERASLERLVREVEALRRELSAQRGERAAPVAAAPPADGPPGPDPATG